MASRIPKDTFVPTLHFVNSGDTKDRRARNVHAQRQVVRKNRWLALKHRQAFERAHASGLVSGQLEGLDGPQSRGRGPSLHGPKGADGNPKEGANTTALGDSSSSESRRGTSIVSWSHLDEENRPSSSSFPFTRSLVKPPPLSPCTVPGTSAADPFGSAHLTPKRRELMDKYATFFFTSIANMVMLIPKTGTPYHAAMDSHIPYALQDAAPFEALLAVSVAFWDKLHGMKPGPDALSHKLKAIQAINQRLQDPENLKGELSDITIAAVSLLWTLEARYITPEALQAHIKGLEQLITCRGGYGSISGRLSVSLAWMIVSLPGAMSLLYSETLSTPLPPIIYLHICLGEFFNAIDTTARLFQSRPLLHSRNAHFFGTETPLHRLLHPSWSKEPSRLPNMHHLKTVCRLSILLWISAIYTEHLFPPPSHIPTELALLRARALRHHLDTNGSLELMWSILIKAEGVMVPHKRAYAVVRIMSVAKNLSMSTLDEVSDLLFGCLTDTLTTEEAGWRAPSVTDRVKSELGVAGDVATGGENLYADAYGAMVEKSGRSLRLLWGSRLAGTEKAVTRS